MEEKKMRELNLDEMDKVSGGVSDFEKLNETIRKSGILPEILALPRPQAIQALIDYCNQNGLSEYIRYTQAVYDTNW